MCRRCSCHRIRTEAQWQEKGHVMSSFLPQSERAGVRSLDARG